MEIVCQSYKIYIDPSISSLIDKIDLSPYSKVFLLCDENTERDCLPLVKDHLPEFDLIRIDSGEINKTLETSLKIWRQMLDLGADRKSILINLGGGVIGDMGGFCASTFMRGIDFLQMPTSLLSQVDASVGSKLGVDLDANKNLIGLFNDPIAVCIHTPFITTLDKRERTSGFAEVIKHALIQDKDLWEQLQSFDVLDGDIPWDAIVTRSVEIKRDVVEKDPKEAGLRKILNFGHSIGHALESERLNSNEPLTHGEAIALGMICEAHISLQRKMITREEYTDLREYIFTHFDKALIIAPDKNKILARMTKDKKNEKGQKLLSLLDGIGSCSYNIAVDDIEIENAIDHIASL